MADFVFKITDNTEKIIKAVREARGRSLEIIGEQAEDNAKENCSPVGAKGQRFPADLISNIRNSITHGVDGDRVSIGTGMDIGAFAELGTGNLYSPPAGFLEVGVGPGPHHGLDHWWFMDKDGHWEMGLPIPPSPFIQPAITEHMGEYEKIIVGELGKIE